MISRVTRLTTGLLSFYAVSLILTPLLKGWIPGAAGTVITCFIEMFYALFIFPYCIKKLETVPLTDPDL